MGALVAFIAVVAALDSLNPSTVAPAAFLSGGLHARRRVAAFTAGVAAVSTLGGVAIVLLLGKAALDSISKPDRHLRQLIEVATGAVLLGLAALLWHLRLRIWHGEGRARVGRHGPAFLGAAIMAAELPTAFPYFAALAAIAEATRSLATACLLVAAYNVIFVAPLLAIFSIAGTPRATKSIAALLRFAPWAVPLAVALIGGCLVVIGSIGLAG